MNDTLNDSREIDVYQNILSDIASVNINKNNFKRSIFYFLAILSISSTTYYAYVTDFASNSAYFFLAILVLLSLTTFKLFLYYSSPFRNISANLNNEFVLMKKLSKYDRQELLFISNLLENNAQVGSIKNKERVVRLVKKVVEYKQNGTFPDKDEVNSIINDLQAFKI